MFSRGSMKTAEANFHFPVLGFTPDKEIWGFEDLNSLTSCGPRTLKDNMQLGMELIDADGKRWVVRSVRRIGRAESLLRTLIDAVLTASPQSRIEQELDELTPVSFAEIRDRACVSMEKNWECYCHFNEREEFEPRLAEVRSAKSVAQIFELMGLDSFMGY